MRIFCACYEVQIVIPVFMAHPNMSVQYRFGELLIRISSLFSPVVEPPVANGAVVHAPPPDPLSEAHGAKVVDVRVLLAAPLLREHLDISSHLACVLFLKSPYEMNFDSNIIKIVVI